MVKTVATFDPDTGYLSLGSWEAQVRPLLLNLMNDSHQAQLIGYVGHIIQRGYNVWYGTGPGYNYHDLFGFGHISVYVEGLPVWDDMWNEWWARS